ncbi:MAG: hypothetical protein ACLGHN_01895 [Bacteriovoracia bacterium]
MEFTAVCKTCRKPKAPYICGLCEEHVCKACAQFQTDAFSFLQKVPAELSHSVYCSQCFDEKIAAPLSDYEEMMEKAKDVMVFFKNESKKTGHIKRKEEPLKVEDCEDEDETVLRLAFFAAQKGFNCLLDVQLTNRKIIVGSHKKTVFSGTAIPVTIDPKDVREY